MLGCMVIAVNDAEVHFHHHAQCTPTLTDRHVMSVFRAAAAAADATKTRLACVIAWRRVVRQHTTLLTKTNQP